MAFCILTDIKTLLTSVTSDIYRNEQPETPASLICLYDTSGYDPTHCFGTQSPKYETPGFQVVVRHTSLDTAKTWMESIKNALDGKTATTINSHVYLGIWQQGDTVSLGRDEQRRTRLALNFIAQVKR